LQISAGFSDTVARRMRSSLLASLIGALLGAGSALASSPPTGGAVGFPTATKPSTTTAVYARRAPDPLRGRGMWIWELPSSSGGNTDAIASQARRYGISMLMIKAGDGATAWSQFNPELVSALHHSHIRVCAWQYVYGNDPVGEANVGAQAVRDGADCLLIDAESEYEGKYHQAQEYMTTLRKQVGYGFPLGLAGFPYVDYHPAFPYSVFLGRGGAQYNVPQMYWKDIGVSVNSVYAHTFLFNRPYNRPISPLGQVYNNPPTWQIEHFRQLQRYYSPRTGVSWWDWQQASAKAWFAISKPTGPLPGFTAVPGMAALGKGALGDMVVWAQEHLVSAGDPVTVDGAFGPKTFAAVESFQLAHGLPETGLVDTDTWNALLHYAPAYVRWRLPAKRKGKAAVVARASSVAGLAAGVAPPKSASLPELGDELPGAPGRGRP
jgi:peptidoglycan hydrolase-like protein with peptidoglycan-binding domain